MKKSSKNPEYAEMRHKCDMVTSFNHYNHVKDLGATGMRLYFLTFKCSDVIYEI